jgi:EAL domain-containing protein (putative c-di-GMP-specific phosphodiesterase class I)
MQILPYIVLRTRGAIPIVFTQQKYLPRIQYPGDRKSLELCLQGECLLYYQPQLVLQTDSLAGVEVLLGWHSPELGWIPPDRFIPIAFTNWIDLARRANGF